MVKRRRKHPLIEIGSLWLGEYTDGEVGEWELDPEQAVLDYINESRNTNIRKLKLFVLLPEEG